MSASDSSSQDVVSVRCPRCGHAFDCGARAKDITCWCRAMPALPVARLDAGSGCLCPECLASEIASVRRSGAPGAPDG
ncbi:cysteine-rich CWC family protein [Paraburkholderia sartisoli]|uniref:cysteine-rich CWC family protein n=1 Tax=Paraburkholderia sartisoli TaxID=83784 RepID=UPI000B874FDB|nr:cysteine-rich CWC family protein [Paraburkholderia sartisoli]